MTTKNPETVFTDAEAVIAGWRDRGGDVHAGEIELLNAAEALLAEVERLRRERDAED